MRALFKTKKFRDRADAGRQLATRLRDYAGRSDVLVFGLPRGGVPVAFEIARSLNLPLDAFLVRKLGVPGHEELAMGAVAMGGIQVLNPDVVADLDIPGSVIERAAASEWQTLEERNEVYRQGRPVPDVRGRTVILVDDGLATGATMRAAIAALRLEAPSKIVAAVPTGAAQSCAELREEVDELVCLMEPDFFYAISLWYDDFSAVSDDTVRALLGRGATFDDRR